MEAATEQQKQAAPPPRLRETYEQEVKPALTQRFGYTSPMAVPTLEKITLNMGVGEAKQNTQMLEAAEEQLATIAGQAPSVRRAKKSVASFKVREGMPVGVAVTLRRARMWEFLDRLNSIAVPTDPRLPRPQPAQLRWTRELLDRHPRADHLPRDRL